VDFASCAEAIVEQIPKTHVKITAREGECLRAVTLSGNRIGFENVPEGFEGLELNVTAAWMHVGGEQFDEWAQPFSNDLFSKLLG